MDAITVFNANPAVEIAIAVSTLGVILAIGAMLLPRSTTGGCPLFWVAAALTSGLIFFNGVSATVIMGRFGFYSFPPLAQLVLAAIWRRTQRKSCSLNQMENLRGLLPPLAALLAACALFVWWFMSFTTADGAVRNIYGDLGYYGQLAMGLKKAGHASLWSGTLGAALKESGGQMDVWYHWGGVLLGAALHQWTGRPIFSCLLFEGEIIINFILIVNAGAIIRSLTGWSCGRSLLAGAVSMFAVVFLRVLVLLPQVSLIPFDVHHYYRVGLLTHFPYKADALPLLLAAGAWLRGKNWLALPMLFFAGFAAPHVFAAGGVMAGALLTVGILMRHPRMWRTAAVVIGVLLMAAAVLAVGFGVTVPKSPDSQMVTFGIETIRNGLREALLDSVINLLLLAPVLPGIVHLMRSAEGTGDASAERRRVLGWMAICAVAGSYAAYHIFLGLGDRAHFTTFTHVVMVLPVGIWGLASLVSRSRGWRKYAAVSLLVLCAMLGAADIGFSRSQVARTKWSVQDLTTVRASLGDEPFGYFAKLDRNWWIPKHATLASMMGVRCLRVNGEISVDNGGATARYYGSSRPYVLVPRETGETAAQWSLRFARKTGVRHLLEIGDDTLPDEIKAAARLVVSSGPLKLYQLL